MPKQCSASNEVRVTFSPGKEEASVIDDSPSVPFLCATRMAISLGHSIVHIPLCSNWCFKPVMDNNIQWGMYQGLFLLLAKKQPSQLDLVLTWHHCSQDYTFPAMLKSYTGGVQHIPSIQLPAFRWGSPPPLAKRMEESQWVLWSFFSAKLDNMFTLGRTFFESPAGMPLLSELACQGRYVAHQSSCAANTTRSML